MIALGAGHQTKIVWTLHYYIASTAFGSYDANMQLAYDQEILHSSPDLQLLHPDRAPKPSNVS